MAAITTFLKSDNFIICHGFLGPNEMHETVLKGDGLTNQWMYCLFRPLKIVDNVESCCGKLEIFDRFNDSLIETQTIKNGTLLNLHKWIGLKLKATVNDNFSYYFSFNPIPYTDQYDCTLYDDYTFGDFDLSFNDNERYVIPITGKCLINNNKIEEKQYAKILPKVNSRLTKDKDSIIALFTKK